MAMKHAAIAKQWCRVVEAAQETLCSERATEARQHEAWEEEQKA